MIKRDKEQGYCSLCVNGETVPLQHLMEIEGTTCETIDFERSI